MTMEQWAMSESLLEHRINEEILEELEARGNQSRWSWEGEGWNGSGTLKEEIEQKQIR